MKKLFEFLAKEGVTPNGALALWCIDRNMSFSNYINMSTELYRLSIDGYVEEIKEQDFKRYILTKKGKHLLQDAERCTKSSKENATPDTEQWLNEIQKFNERFPKGKKADTIYTFKTAPRELMPRFQWFFTEYPEYTWEDVHKATDMYVKHFEESGDFRYMQLNKYFLKKEDKNKIAVSNLATLIDNMKNNNLEDEAAHGHFYFGP